ncbi:hypothetical protein D3C84_1243330 [compost metagenome]
MQHPAELEIQILAFAAVAVILILTGNGLVVVIAVGGNPGHPVTERYRIVPGDVLRSLAALVLQIGRAGDIEQIAERKRVIQRQR